MASGKMAGSGGSNIGGGGGKRKDEKKDMFSRDDSIRNSSGDILRIGTQDKDKIRSERKEKERVETIQEDIVHRRGTDTRGGSRASQVLRRNKEEEDDINGASVSRRVLLGF
jgi:hypothetical protein